MKKFILVVLLILGLSLPCLANSTINFQWDPNMEPDLEGYRLYQSAVSGNYTFGADTSVATILAGTEAYSLDNVLDGKWFWVLTAYDVRGHESDPGNEVTIVLGTVMPDSPTGLRIQ